jgi:hypothetical protein
MLGTNTYAQEVAWGPISHFFKGSISQTFMPGFHYLFPLCQQVLPVHLSIHYNGQNGLQIESCGNFKQSVINS